MRIILSILLTFFLHPAFSQDCGWISPALGLSGTSRSVMARAGISVTYLRHDRFGFTLEGEASGRMKSFRRPNSLQSFDNAHACFTWNLRPWYDVKLLLRGGISRGNYTYLDEYLGTVEYPTGGLFTNIEEKYATTTTRAYGGYLGFEVLFNTYGRSRAVSLEAFTHISRYWIGGVSLRLNFGAL